MAEKKEKSATPEEIETPAVALLEPTESAADLPADAPPPAVPKSRSLLPGALLGGLIAAGAGFGLAQFVPQGWPMASSSPLQAAFDTQAAEIAGLKDQLAALEPRLLALESAPKPDGSAEIATLSDRLTSLESAPAADGDALRALEAEVAALKSSGVAPSNSTALAAEAEARLKEVEAAAAQMRAEAETLAAKAATTAALGRVQAALNTGAAFADSLPSLGADIPADLAALATTGVPTLAALQDGFPIAARAALEASLRDNMGESWSERVGSFLRSQTGARALTPQEGNDPDAVLSRAEAALTANDLPTALQELSALPEAGQTAMAEWRALAQSRVAAAAAIAAIASNIGE